MERFSFDKTTPDHVTCVRCCEMADRCQQSHTSPRPSGVRHRADHRGRAEGRMSYGKKGDKSLFEF